MKSPGISVIMPVYNAENFLTGAIKSILMQTFSDFEFIILNDGSQDGSLNIIKKFKDKRIKLINNEKNQGYLKLLNYGISIAKGKYIARMDNDDISLPCRFKLQYSFLEKNLDYIMVGSNVKTIDHNDKVLGGKWYEKMDYNTLYALLQFTNCIVHPSVMLRKRDLPVDLYKEEYYPAEDYELWGRLAKTKKIYNLPEVLFYYRKHSLNASFKQIILQRSAEKEIFRKNLLDLGLEFNENDLNFHQGIKNGEILFTDENINLLIGWLEKILYANNIKNIYNQKSLKNAISIHILNLFSNYHNNEFKIMLSQYIYIMNKLDINYNIKTMTKTIFKSYCKHLKK